MYFIVRQAVYNGAAGFLEAFRPVYVIGLVKAGPQLHYHRHFFSVFCGSPQIIYQRGFARKAVYGYLYGYNPRIVGGLLQELQERRHLLIRVRKEYILSHDSMYHGFSLDHPHRPLWLKRFVCHGRNHILWKHVEQPEHI